MGEPRPAGEAASVSRAVLQLEDLEDFFENAALSLHWVGPDGTILRANQFELDFLGYSREEYEGQHIAKFHVDQPVIEDILTRLIAGETIHDQEARLYAKDGSVKHVIINSNVRWDGERFIHTRCFTRDITDRVRAERELAEAKMRLEETVEIRTSELRAANESLQELLDLKDRFVAMVSHELRTPLTSIAGFSMTMERLWDSLADDQKRGFVEIIGQQSDRLTRLVGNLLTLSSLASNTLEVREHRILVRETIAQTLDQLNATSITIDCPDDLAVHGDRDYLQQILVNYVANALKYGAAPITIEAERKDDFAEVRVRDHGRGVPQDFRPRLFEEFAHRGLDDASDPQPGTGLGLSIVRQLADAQGGRAWFEPNEPRGAVFAVRLPLSDQ